MELCFGVPGGGTLTGAGSQAGRLWGEFVVAVRRNPGFLRTHKLQGTVPGALSAHKASGVTLQFSP